MSTSRYVGWIAAGCTPLYALLLLVTWQFFLRSFMLFDGGIAWLFVAFVMAIPLSLVASLVGTWVAFGLRAYTTSLFFCALPICVSLFSIVSITTIGQSGMQLKNRRAIVTGANQGLSLNLRADQPLLDEAVWIGRIYDEDKGFSPGRGAKIVQATGAVGEARNGFRDRPQSIGRSIAHLFAQEGAAVAISYRADAKGKSSENYGGVLWLRRPSHTPRSSAIGSGYGLVATRAICLASLQTPPAIIF